MDKQILEIVKNKDDFANVVEISENAKGEVQISVKVRSDSDVKSAGQAALLEYLRLRKELKREELKKWSDIVLNVVIKSLKNWREIIVV